MALGYAHLDMDRAVSLFRALFSRQATNGALYQSHHYKAKSGVFPSDVGGVPSMPTNSDREIICAPLYGFILWELYQIAKNKNEAKLLLQEFYPKIIAFHRYLYAFRDPLDEGLLVVDHPLEMGRRTEKGGNTEQILDPLFNGLLTYSNECLIQIGSLLKADFQEVMDWHELTIYSMNEKLWDEDRGIYNAYDLQLERLVPSQGLSGFVPMIGEVPTQVQAEAMLLLLESEAYGGAGDHFFCPTESLDVQPNGKINAVMNWILYQGLERYDMYELADRVRQDSLALMSRYGFKDTYPMHKADNIDQELQAGAPSTAAAMAVAFYYSV